MLAVAAMAIAGCGISDPDAPPQGAVEQTAPVAHRRPAAPVAPPPSAATSSERALLGRFAHAWITYTFATLPSQQRELAALATGTLARQLRRNSEADLEAQYIRVANVDSRGAVEAIVARPNATAIVVARERLTTNGQTQTSWDVYLASVADTAAGLRVASWTPASE
jgi:hypothetical protein